MEGTPTTTFCLSPQHKFLLLTPFYGIGKMVLSGVIVKLTVITHTVTMSLLLATSAITLSTMICLLFIYNLENQ